MLTLRIYNSKPTARV